MDSKHQNIKNFVSFFTRNKNLTRQQQARGTNSWQEISILQVCIALENRERTNKVKPR